METMVHVNGAAEKEKALSLFRDSFQFRVFHRLPQLENFTSDPRWMARVAETTIEDALEWSDVLFASGLWIKLPNGKIKVSDDELNYVAKVPDYLSVNASILARLSEKGPCWYENNTIATNEELYREFNKRINNEFIEFEKKSKTVKADKIVTYSFNILRTSEVTNSKEKEQ